MKQIKPYWIVKIIGHDEWSGPEVEDIVAFSDEDHALALDYAKMLRHYSQDMGYDYYWTVDEPVIHRVPGLLVDADVHISYNGRYYYDHLQKFGRDEVDFRLPSNKLS